MENLVEKLHEQVVLAVKRTLVPQKVGIAFSGGVDSSLLAKICSDLGFEITLLTIGFEHSHDVEFSRKIAAQLGLRQLILVIPEATFPETARETRAKIGTDNLSWNENCIAFSYVSRLAKENGIGNVLTSNGIDELFCGYNAYRDVVEGGEQAVMELVASKIDNEVRMMRAVNMVASKFGVVVLQPLLSEEFIDFVKHIPLEMKIKDKDDLVRKHIIRELALSVGVPQESALKRKKAMQYGTMIHKNLMKLRKS